jgi:hypothetical protein
MRIASEFDHEAMIPSKYTCDGEDVSPELEFSDIPQETESLAIVMDDPDCPSGTFDHWVVWNIPPETEMIMEGKEPEGTQGSTGFGRRGYGGPCPPSGTHRYFFKLYALDSMLDLEEGSSKDELERAIEGHIIEKAVLMGRYSR